VTKEPVPRSNQPQNLVDMTRVHRTFFGVPEDLPILKAPNKIIVHLSACAAGVDKWGLTNGSTWFIIEP